MTTIKKIKIDSLAPNQYIIKIEGEGTYFQSYKSIIVAKTPEGTFLDEYYWNYSKTTGKYRNIFLNEDRKETEKKIKTGKYKLIYLN